MHRWSKFICEKSGLQAACALAECGAKVERGGGGFAWDQSECSAEEAA